MPLGFVVFAVPVPMERVLDSIIEPGLFVNVDFRAVTATATDLAYAVAHDPKCRPMPWLLLKFDAGDIVAEGMLELALGAHAAVDVAVAFLERADDQVALAVERNCLPHPPPAFAWRIGHDFPFGLVEPRALEFVVPDEFPSLPVGGGRQLVGQACIVSVNQVAGNG